MEPLLQVEPVIHPDELSEPILSRRGLGNG